MKTIKALFLVLLLSLPLYAKDFYITTPGNSDATEAQLEKIPAYRLLKEAYNRMGYTVKFRFLPVARAAYSVDAGKMDALFMSTAMANDKYKNILRVEPEVSKTIVRAFSFKHDFKVQGAKSFSKYKVGLMRGSNFKSTLSKAGINIYEVNRAEQACKMLKSGRIDLVVLNELYIQYAQSDCDGIKKLSPPYIDLKLYHFVNKKHEGLLPELSKHINDIKAGK